MQKYSFGPAPIFLILRTLNAFCWPVDRNDTEQLESGLPEEKFNIARSFKNTRKKEERDKVLLVI